MNGLTTYLFIGAILIGGALGGRLRDCPHEDLPSALKIAGVVAIWPVLVVIAITAGGHIQKRECAPQLRAIQPS